MKQSSKLFMWSVVITFFIDLLMYILARFAIDYFIPNLDLGIRILICLFLTMIIWIQIDFYRNDQGKLKSLWKLKSIFTASKYRRIIETQK